MTSSTKPHVIHAHAGGLSLVFDCSFKKVPRLVYWGQELVDETPSSLESLAIASREALDGNAPDIIAQTGLVPLESDGWKGRPGLVGFRQGGTSWSPRFELKNVVTPAGKNFFGAGSFHFDLEDPQSQLAMQIKVELLEQGIARTQVKLTNTSDSEYHLEELGVAFPLPLEANEVLDTTGRWGKEHHPQRRPVTVSCDLKEGRHGRTGFDAPGMTLIGPKGFSFNTGEVWGFHTAFSGNQRTWVEKLPSGDEVVGGSQLLMPGEVTLLAQQSYTSPWFYVLHANGLDQAANRVHRWMRSRPQHVKSDRPVTLNVWEAVYFRHDLDELKNLAKVAAEIGVERYVLDDGWFLGRRNDWAGLGDWIVDPQVWPNGLAPLADYVHSLGMQFGLWFEPEMINLDSNLAREHPEWIMGAQGTTDQAALPVPWRHQQVLNLAIPQASTHIEERIVDLVHEYGIDYIKWDHNRDLIEAGTAQEGGRAAVDAQTRALYKLVDKIKARCPGLEIESCSSGGGRIDLEILQHMDRVWVSDCIDPVERQEMTRWLTQIVPPEMMGTHVASPHSHTTGRWSNLAMRGATALWGHFGIEWDIASASPDEVAELGEWIAYYKRMRRFLHTANLVRCESPDETIWLSGAVNPEKTQGLYQMVTRARAAIAPRGRIRFEGLDLSKQYRIRPVLIGHAPSGLVAPAWFGLGGVEYDSTNQRTFDKSQKIPGIVLTGEALKHSGVQVPRLHPDQVLLIEVKEEK